MGSRGLFTGIAALAATLVLSLAPGAGAAVRSTQDASAAAGAITDSLAAGAFTTATFPVLPGVLSQCEDGIDNDGDGRIDFTPPTGGTADPGCQSAGDNREQDDGPPECSDGIDNDADGRIDFSPPAGQTADPECGSPLDDQESPGTDPPAACSDGLDNDDDGRIDFTPPTGGTADPGCSSSTDLDEGSEGIPPNARPAAVADSPLAGFPTSGSTFSILSSGHSELADDANDNPGTGVINGDAPGSQAHGNVRDLVQLRINVTVPPSANCMQLDFRFLSEEYPEFVGSAFNDGFIAELDTSDFQATSSAITAPNNFAFDDQGRVISINSTGFSAAEAGGTTYDGATPLLRAATPITPGAHSIYLSVFDVDDAVLDSAAFIDKMRLLSVPAGSCNRGATSDTTAPDTTIANGPTGTTTDATPTFEFTSNEPGTFQCRVDTEAFGSCSTPHTTGSLSNGSHTFEVRAVDVAGNIDPTPASRTFTVSALDVTPPQTTITAGPTGPTTDNTPTFQFSSSEAGSRFECSVDSGAFTSCTTPHTTAVLAEGPHTFEVRATDAADNVDDTQASRSFIVDTRAPQTTITAGPTGPTIDNTPTFEFRSSEAGSRFACRVDSGAFAICTSPHTTAALGEGPHTFEVRAIDAAGNVDPSPATPSDASGVRRTFVVLDAGQGNVPGANLSSPRVGRTFNAAVLSGQVLVSLPAGGARASVSVPGLKGRNFIPLREARTLPIGSILDTRRGRVGLATARNTSGKTQSGEFQAGVFQVRQSRRKRSKGLTELRLKGSSFRACARRARGKRSATIAAARSSRRTIRRLRGNGSGRFSTRGRYSAATVRGTDWTVSDRCDGTLTKVKRGKVAVRDFRRRKTVLVRAGKRYLARAPR